MISYAHGAFDPPFLIHEPHDLVSPLVFSVPHSGRIYPEEFTSISRLSGLALRRSEDAFVDCIFKDMTGLGAPVLIAQFPRAYLDVNREPYELEPRLFDGKLPHYANTHSARVLGGLGTIPRIVADGCEIYWSRLAVEEGLGRIEMLYRPYHEALQVLIKRTKERFGFAILVDCHSMPSIGLGAGEPLKRPDVILGDVHGQSCAAQLVELIEALFIEQGYDTIRNNPYAGGFITEFYGRPAAGCHALQIELNRGLYMDEELIELLPNFGHIAGDMWTIFQKLVSVVCGGDGFFRPATE